MERPKSVGDALRMTILHRGLRKVGEVTDFSQEELAAWEKVPAKVRRKMSADEIAEWRRRLKSQA